MMDNPKVSRKLLLLALTLITVVLILISNTSALGVTPARTTVEYSPGEERTVSFSVVNSEYKDISLVVFVKGDLNQSVELSGYQFDMPSTMESKEISFTYNLPEGLSPGAHSADIVIMQKPKDASASEAFVGATVAVSHQLLVNVPYPGKYLQAQLNVINAEQNADATIFLPLLNLGKESIDNSYAQIKIFDLDNALVGQTETNAIGIGGMQRAELTANWRADVPLGRYIVKAVVDYDGEKIELEKEFTVGNETLELQQVNVPGFSLGGIAKFEMLIENKWSEPIIGAYAQTQVFDSSGNLMADFKSPTYDIPPLNKSTFVSYWDTEGVEEGTYDTSVYMRYGSKYSQQNIQLRVSNDEIVALGLGFVISERSGRSPLVTVLIIVIVILALMNILWFLVLRKKMKK